MIIIDHDKDEKLDSEFLKEIIAKEDNYQTIAKLLTDRFTKKYELEFGGFIKVECGIVDHAWKVTYGRDGVETFDPDQLDDIPEAVRNRRDLKSKKMKK